MPDTGEHVRPGTRYINKLSVAIEDCEGLIEALEDLRDRAIREYEPERCCPNCDFIAGRGEEWGPCPPLNAGCDAVGSHG